MNTTRLIWGIICLVLAGTLTVLNFVLPPENLMFMVGDANVPILPAIILGIVGIVLLATAENDKQDALEKEVEIVSNPEKAALNKRLESIAWGCFLIMLGGAMFISNEVVSSGVWTVGVGLIMLGLNAARYTNGIKMSGFTTVLGILSLVGGIFQLFGWRDVEGALLIIILGIYLIIKPQLEQRELFGKAETS